VRWTRSRRSSDLAGSARTQPGRAHRQARWQRGSLAAQARHHHAPCHASDLLTLLLIGGGIAEDSRGQTVPISTLDQLVCALLRDADRRFSIRPAVPVYWRCTPTVWVPFFRSPVSSSYADVGIGGPMPTLELCRHGQRWGRRWAWWGGLLASLIRRTVGIVTVLRGRPGESRWACSGREGSRLEW